MNEHKLRKTSKSMNEKNSRPNSLTDRVDNILTDMADKINQRWETRDAEAAMLMLETAEVQVKTAKRLLATRFRSRELEDVLISLKEARQFVRDELEEKI